MNEAVPYGLKPGASWVTPDGTVHPVPGFHAQWLANNPELSHGASDVAGMIAVSGWISATLYAGGFLELLVSDFSDRGSREFVHAILTLNAGAWTKVVLIPVLEEGDPVVLEPADCIDRDRSGRILDEGIRGKV